MLKDLSEYRVLIVDDIPTNVWLLKVMLEQAGLQILTAENSEDVFRHLQNEQVDLILLDVLMPDMDGFELASRLKNNPEYNEIPIVFLTALNAPTDVVKGFNLGAEDFISKPFNKEELLIRIKHQLSLLEANRTIKRKTEELRRTIAGRDALYSVIAHDLRMPLSSIKMILNVLTLKMKELQIGSEELREMMQSANEISEHLFALLDNLLKWTNAQQGRLKAIPHSIDLAELAEGVVEVFNIVAATKEIKIDFHAPEEKNCEIFVDIDMIKTAIRNLISNALKYSYPGSSIDVIVETKDENVRFMVVDYGCGISDEDQCKLIDPSIHYTTFGTKHETGSGLGLLLVNEFLKLNNGEFFFNSKEGEGSTFGFTLPRIIEKK